MNCGIINIDNMYTLIHTLLENIVNNINDATQLFCNDEIIENLYILITKGKTVLIEQEENWAIIITKIETFANKKFRGLTKKTSFKCYDILDEIENEDSDSSDSDDSDD